MRKLLFIFAAILTLLVVGCSEETPEKEYPKGLEGTIEKHVAENYHDTTMKDIQINDDLGTGEGKIVLVYLSFDAKNKAGTAKEMIDMYGEDLGATLANENEINEITIFWEVPYLKEGDNIAKLMMSRSDDGMAIDDKWYDSNIFE